MRKLAVRNRQGQVITTVSIDSEDYPLVEGGALSISPSGHVYVYKEGERVLLHRLVMGLQFGDPREVDHQNGKPSDNRKSNLRICTRQLNAHNRLPSKTYGGRAVTSKHRGVSWHSTRQRWQVSCQVNGLRHFIGFFDDEYEAAQAAIAFRRQHMPFSTH